jgi:hypothetical protein
MIPYMKDMLAEFPIKFEPKDGAPSAAADNLFSPSDLKLLMKHQADVLHHFVAQGLWACQHARPNIQPAVVVLCT